MSFQFTPAPPMQEGALFLGVNGYASGIRTPRHLVTIAGSRSGKGAALIIPNLRQWSAGSVLVIDPKGENAEATWKHREAMGHKVYVVDPFRVAKVPARLRAAFNPLEAVFQREAALRSPIFRDKDGREHSRADLGHVSTAREDIRVIADGLVMRSKKEDAMWDNGAVTVLAGLIAHTISTAPPDKRNLVAMRSLLRWTDEALEESVWPAMSENPAFGGLAEAAAAVGLSSAKSAREFVKGARDQTEWLDSDPMRAVLDHSAFDLAELKNGKTAVYLVLPADYLDEHGRFLRLFVRCALSAMAKGGQGGKGGKCLFLLDEFFSLGHISEIAKAAGLMPSYGVHLWPFLQDLGQLVSLYGKEGAETFFGNADAHIFFGNTDPLTLEHVSARFGRYGANELVTARPHPLPPPLPRMGSTDPIMRADEQREIWADHMARIREQSESHAQSVRYEAEARKVGQPRIAPETVREMVGKKADDDLARSMIVFGQGGDIFQLLPWGYWYPPAPSKADLEREARQAEANARLLAAFGLKSA